MPQRRVATLLTVAFAATSLTAAGCAVTSAPDVPNTSTTARPRPKPTPTKTTARLPEQRSQQRLPVERVRWRAASAIDGDTIRLDNGQSVRVVGIDTPEAGACGYQQASAATARLVAAGVVPRRAKGENRDHYGRLLRYVRTRHGDLGTILLRRGLAIARYDSSDGYGWHPLERRYHRIDAATPKRCAVAPGRLGAPPPVRQGVSTGDCDTNYTGACVPPSTADLDCADLPGAVRIVGTDRHGFDGDGDGRGCE